MSKAEMILNLTDEEFEKIENLLLMDLRERLNELSDRLLDALKE